MTLVQPTPDMQIQIREFFNENVNTRQSDVEHIKEWLLKQPHLPDTWDENRIMTFLRTCKFSLEKTKRKLDMYFTMRTACPEFFSNRDINSPELQRISQLANIPPLPGLTTEGRRVIILSSKQKLTEIPPVADVAKLVLMIGDVRMAAEITGVAGDVYIIDASVINASHYAKVSPSMVKKFLVCVQEAYPVNLKQVHVVNISPIVDIIVQFAKPLLKEKLQNRIHLHSTYETLHQLVPKEILPEEYGGTAGKISDFHEEWMKKLDECGPWFKAQEDIKADESKRPGKPTNYDDLFGLDGSFRQLTID